MAAKKLRAAYRKKRKVKLSLEFKSGLKHVRKLHQMRGKTVTKISHQQAHALRVLLMILSNRLVWERPDRNLLIVVLSVIALRFPVMKVMMTTNSMSVLTDWWIWAFCLQHYQRCTSAKMVRAILYVFTSNIFFDHHTTLCVDCICDILVFCYPYKHTAVLTSLLISSLLYIQ